MHIICLTPVEPGVYNDHCADNITAPPHGWAMIPEGFSLPSTFPRLGGITAEERSYTCTAEVLNEDGSSIAKPVAYTVMTVTAMSEGTLPETVEGELPSQLDRLEAQLTYTAMMTDTLLEV